MCIVFTHLSCRRINTPWTVLFYTAYSYIIGLRITSFSFASPPFSPRYHTGIMWTQGQSVTIWLPYHHLVLSSNWGLNSLFLTVSCICRTRYRYYYSVTAWLQLINSKGNKIVHKSWIYEEFTRVAVSCF